MVELQVDSTHNVAHLFIAVNTRKLPAQTRHDAEKLLEPLLSECVGGKVSNVSYEFSPSEESEDEDETPVSSKHPLPPPEEWSVSADIGGNMGGPVRRQGLLQTGSLDLRPLKTFLKTYGVSDVEVIVQLDRQMAPVSECTGLPPSKVTLTGSRRRSFAIFKNRFALSDLPESPIHFAVGYRTLDVLQAYLPTATVLTLPLILAFLLQRFALKAQDKYEARESSSAQAGADPTGAIWLGCFRLLHHGTMVFSLIWLSVSIATKPENVLRWYFAANSAEARTALSYLTVVLPIPILQVLSILILRPVYTRLKNTEISVTEIVLQTGGQIVLNVLPLMFTWIGVNTFLSSGTLPILMMSIRVHSPEAQRMLLQSLFVNPIVHRAIGWLALAATLRWLFNMALPLLNQLQPLELTGGQLKDRITALAKQAGVNVTRAIYLPTGWDKMANAFAAKGNFVILTDRLLMELSRDEVDGVIAHELAHLKHRHPLWLSIMGIAGIAFIIGLPLLLITTHLFPTNLYDRYFFIVLPLMLLTGILIQTAISRSWEKVADTTAVRWTGNPAALITGLMRLSRINGAPEEWSRWEQPILTHPSTRRRAAYLAAEHALSATESAALSGDIAMEPVPEAERYALPVLSNPDLIFSQKTQQRKTITSVYITLTLLVLLPGIIALITQQIASRNPMLLVIFSIAGTVLILASYYTYQVYYSQRQTLRLETRLRERMQTSDLLPVTEEEPIFVGIAPSGEPQRFNGRPDFDRGYLLLEEEQIRFVGERLKFTVPRKALRPIFDVGKWPSWFPLQRIGICWPDPTVGNESTTATTITIHALNKATLPELQMEGMRLFDRLKRYQESYPTDEQSVLSAIDVSEEGIKEIAITDTTETDGAPLIQPTAVVPRITMGTGMSWTQLMKPAIILTASKHFAIAGLAFGCLLNLSLPGILYAVCIGPGIFLIEYLFFRQQLTGTASVSGRQRQ